VAGSQFIYINCKGIKTRRTRPHPTQLNGKPESHQTHRRRSLFQSKVRQDTTSRTPGIQRSRPISSRARVPARRAPLRAIAHRVDLAIGHDPCPTCKANNVRSIGSGVLSRR